MSDTTRIKSSLMLPVSISEPLPAEFADKPGLAPPMKTGVIKPGMNDVDANLWKAYSGSKPSLVTEGHLAEVSGDEASKKPGAGFGFEPALKAASTDGASDGSTVKAAGPVSSADMKPTGTTPNDDSPRSQTPAPVTPAAAAVPATKPASAPSAK